MSETKKPRRLLRFTLAGLLLFLTWFAAALSGYRVGFSRGAEEWRNRRVKPFYVKVYEVSDLLERKDHVYALTHSSRHPLVDLVTMTVAPDEWDTVGGPASIQPVPNKIAVTVRAPPYVHEEIAGLLEQLRGNGKPIEDELKAVREKLSRKEWEAAYEKLLNE